MNSLLIHIIYIDKKQTISNLEYGVFYEKYNDQSNLDANYMYSI